ncbi:MAG: hypothetical protein FJ319_14700, partial [SAR202 cluster bacterium]|nr:hypothetical protein [SAR202 cluster bacterium]
MDGLLAMLARGAHLGLCHIGNQDEITIRELAAKVLRCMGREVQLISGKEPPSATTRRIHTRWATSIASGRSTDRPPASDAPAACRARRRGTPAGP